MKVMLQDSLQYVAGATAPAVLLRVEAYPSDPTGATVTFALAGLFDDLGLTIAGIPTLGTIVPVTRNGLVTYDFDLEMAWDDEDLVAGLYYGRFTLTDGTDVYHLPTGRSLIIEVIAGITPPAP